MIIEGNLTSSEADIRLRFWAGKLRSLDATEIAGVEKVYKGGDRWAINLEVYVDKTSPEYIDFIRKFI
jgi:hypothetical protein